MDRTAVSIDCQVRANLHPIIARAPRGLCVPDRRSLLSPSRCTVLSLTLPPEFPTTSPARMRFTPGPASKTSPAPSRPRTRNESAGLRVGDFTQPKLLDPLVRGHEPYAHEL